MSDKLNSILPNEKWRHDIKNQLGVVLGFSELMLSEMGPTDLHREEVEEINRAAQRALDLLALAQPSTD